jgi:drug/metabolite transporter (DMT)-like permease
MQTFDSRTKDALTGAGLALVGFLACLWFIISAGMSDDSQALMRVPLLGIGLAACCVLHWVFVGIAAQRLGRSVVGWLALTVLTFPIASLVALVLLLWFGEAPGEPGKAVG